MKRIFRLLPLMLLLVSVTACAQNKKPSPPASVEFKNGAATITINYGAPSVKGREIWGKLVPYGEVWRAGANDATTFETNKDILVEGKTLPAGKYAFFTIPGENEWILIFNKNAKQWGAYGYKQAEDALRVTVKPSVAASANEVLKYEGTSTGFSLLWEKLEVKVNIKG